MKYQRMKDIAIDVMEIAEDYEMNEEYVGEMVDYFVRSGMPYEEAVPKVRAICEEKYQNDLAADIIAKLRMIRESQLARRAI